VSSSECILHGNTVSPFPRSSSRIRSQRARGPGKRQVTFASFLREHSLSLMLTGLLVVLLALYVASDPQTHLGAFYGNAIADWLGVLVFVVATKYFFEAGSGESRRPAPSFHLRVGCFLPKHSLTIVLTLTGAAWSSCTAAVRSSGRQQVGTGDREHRLRLDPGARLVLMTKYLRERGSKEGQ
jgi:hypothetical protein